MIIYASLELHGNISTVNHIWQAGPMSENTPMMHSVRPSSPNVKSMGCLDFLSGRVKATRSSSTTLKNVHGILNRVSWGILMPIGTVIARYLKRFESADPLWFYLHVSCQLLAFFFLWSIWIWDWDLSWHKVSWYGTELSQNHRHRLLSCNNTGFWWSGET